MCYVIVICQMCCTWSVVVCVRLALLVADCLDVGDMSDSDGGMDDSADNMSDAEEDDYSEFEQPVQVQPVKAFRCVHADDLRAMRASAIKRVAETLCSPPADVAVLLRAFKWDAERVIGAYFENPEGVLEKAGVCDASKRTVIDATAPQPYQCPICLEQVTSYSALGCGHRVCTACYREYIAHKIDDEGSGAIHARCPSIKCGVQLTDVLVNALATEAQRSRFAVYLEQSFVDDNPRLEWCPAPQCTSAIYMAHPSDAAPVLGANRVACDCGESFCFSCRRDDHSPATCEQLRVWLIKCKDDSETYNWLQANTRACPICKTAIEKNGGSRRCAASRLAAVRHGASLRLLPLTNPPRSPSPKLERPSCSRRVQPHDMQEVHARVVLGLLGPMEGALG